MWAPENRCRGPDWSPLPMATGDAASSVNLASCTHGARIISFSSEAPGCDASNVLDQNPSKLWLTDPKARLPQHVVLALDQQQQQQRQRDSRRSVVLVKTLGWFCWHAYSTNPGVLLSLLLYTLRATSLGVSSTVVLRKMFGAKFQLSNGHCQDQLLPTAQDITVQIVCTT